jgi:hypothetical protein
MNASLLATFGVSITYNHGLTGEFAVTVIQEDPNRMEIASPETRVCFWARAADFATYPAIGDPLEFNAQAYKVWDVRLADTEGGIYIYAEKYEAQPE